MNYPGEVRYTHLCWKIPIFGFRVRKESWHGILSHRREPVWHFQEDITKPDSMTGNMMSSCGEDMMEYLMYPLMP